MSVITRTNLATNPSAASTTNFAAVAGTGGTAAVAFNAGVSYTGTGFCRVTWTVATTAISGGISYTQTGLAATTQYTHQMWVQSSVTQKVALGAQYRNVSHTNVGATTNSSIITLTANTWTQLTVTATSGAAVTEVVLTAFATTGGSNWAIGNTFDGEAVCIETGATAGLYFDGSFANGLGVLYNWTGTANASTSTAVAYIPSITCVVKNDAPCDRVVVTVADLTPFDNVVNLWRTADGQRRAVRGVRGWTVNTSNAVTDYEVPLGRTVSYDLEVLTGPSAGVATPTTNVTVTQPGAPHGWMQDPLVPSSAVPLYGDVGPSGEAGLDDSAVKNVDFNASITMLEIQGSSDPIALIGQRLSGSNISFDMTTDSATHAGELLTLLRQAAPLLIRPLPTWAVALPGLCYMAIPKESYLPENEAWGGTTIHWSLTGDTVAAPTSNVLVAVFTYTTVAAIWTTYQQAQTTLSGLGRKYLDVLKSPSGA